MEVPGGNLYALPSAEERGAGEVFTALLTSPGVRIERIVSAGQVSPAGFWYDQDEAEWVLLLSGSAELEFDGGSRRELRAGDWLNIPAHCRHRVTRTADPTVWLAVFCSL